MEEKLRELISKFLKEYMGTGSSGGNATDGNDITSPRPFADDKDEVENYTHKSIYGGDGGHYKNEPAFTNPNRTKMGMFEQSLADLDRQDIESDRGKAKRAIKRIEIQRQDAMDAAGQGKAQATQAISQQEEQLSGLNQSIEEKKRNYTKESVNYKQLNARFEEMPLETEEELEAKTEVYEQIVGLKETLQNLQGEIRDLRKQRNEMSQGIQKAISAQTSQPSVTKQFDQQIRDAKAALNQIGKMTELKKYIKKILQERIGKPQIQNMFSGLVDDRQEVDGSNRSDLIGIALPGIELTTVESEDIEELVSNLFILKDDYKLDQGIPLKRQPENVQTAVEYLNSKEAIEALNQITDIEEAMDAALKAGENPTEKIYTADSFPDGLRDSQFYKDSIEDGWKFVNKLYLNGRNAKNMPVDKDGFALNELKKFIKKILKEQAYGHATLTTQGPPRTGTIVPTDEYPFSARPKRTATGMMEGAFGMSAKDLAATYSLEKLQNIRDEIMGDMEQEAEPEGGRIADMYADQLQGVDDAIAIKQGNSIEGGPSYDEVYLKSKLVGMKDAYEYDPDRGIVIFPDLGSLQYRSRSTQEITFTKHKGEIHFVHAFGMTRSYDELKKVFPELPPMGRSSYSGFFNVHSDKGTIPVDLDTATKMIDAMKKGKDAEAEAQSSFYTRQPGTGGTGIEETLLRQYEKERINVNLMEQMDMYNETTRGSLQKFFEMFEDGNTNEEVIQHYAKNGIQIPEQFISKVKKQFESYKKLKLELGFSEQEAKDMKKSVVLKEKPKKLSTKIFKK